MSTFTKTSVSSAYSLTVTGGVTPPLSNLIVQPLVPSGILASSSYISEQLTPAIGILFNKSLQLADVLAMESTEQRDQIFKDLAISISTNGVAFFSQQDGLTPEGLAAVGLALGTLSGKPEASGLHIHPTQELGENGLP